MSFWFTALNLARYTLCLCEWPAHLITSSTSKLMFSPSLSQSIQSTRPWMPLASDCRCFTTPFFVGFFTIGALKSSAGSTESQLWYSLPKSTENTCPTTDVTRCRILSFLPSLAWPGKGRCVVVKLCVGHIPLFSILDDPCDNALAMEAAMDGFSATCKIIPFWTGVNTAKGFSLLLGFCRKPCAAFSVLLCFPGCSLFFCVVFGAFFCAFF